MPWTQFPRCARVYCSLLTGWLQKDNITTSHWLCRAHSHRRSSVRPKGGSSVRVVLPSLLQSSVHLRPVCIHTVGSSHILPFPIVSPISNVLSIFAVSLPIPMFSPPFQLPSLFPCFLPHSSYPPSSHVLSPFPVTLPLPMFSPTFQLPSLFPFPSLFPCSLPLSS